MGPYNYNEGTMKQFIHILFFSLLANVAFTQIEVGVETLPEAGDVLSYVTFEYSGDTLSYRADGESQSWSFDNFEFTGEVSDTFVDISETEFVDSFPDADLLFNAFGFQAAAKRNTNSLELVGIVSPQIDFLDLSGISLFESPFEYRRAPINFGDSFEDDGRLFFQFTADIIPGVDSLELPIPGATLDSIRFIVEFTKNERAVGWGSLELDGLTQDVLLIEQEDDFDNTIEVGLNLAGTIIWFDASAFFGDDGGGDDGFGFGPTSSTTYKYLNEDSKESIIEFTERRLIDTLGNASLFVEGRISDDFITNVTELTFNISKYEVSPNPSSGQVTVICESEIIKQPTMTVRSLGGEAVWSAKNYNFGELIDLSHLPKGLYLLEINDGDIRRTEKILIQ